MTGLGAKVSVGQQNGDENIQTAACAARPPPALHYSPLLLLYGSAREQEGEKRIWCGERPELGANPMLSPSITGGSRRWGSSFPKLVLAIFMFNTLFLNSGCSREASDPRST